MDKPWLKYYKKKAIEKALNIPKDTSLYRFYIENVFTKPDFPILKYFNTTLTTKKFVKLIDKWARVFRAVGVMEDEMVPVYGTWCPEIAAIFFALNAIGAHPYFEKLDITEEALHAETIGARVGVVFEPLWNDIAKAVFGEERFEKVFMIGLSDSMEFPLRHLFSIKSYKFKNSVTDYNKYIFKKQVEELASSYKSPYEATFKADRIAAITTSSGTTSAVIKGIMDTNEGALANIIGSSYSEPGFIAGRECLITLPPTASTALNCFFLLPLFMGMTVRIDPRADEQSFPDLIIKYKPSLTLSTGSLWYSFCRRIDRMCRNGKSVDLSFLDTPIMGGSGVTPEQLTYMNAVLSKCHAKHSIESGYGCSEFFGVITVDKHDVPYKPLPVDVIDVGIPIIGAVIGIFDENGHELPYGKRGQIWAKGSSVMHGYFNKPELSSQVIENQWLKTGDIGLMDENGYVYCYGRMKSSINIDGEKIYLFDIANELRREFNLEDCMVEVKKLINDEQSIVVYYVDNSDKISDSRTLLKRINDFLNKKGIVVDGYREFNDAFPISPTTLKPKTRYADGFINFTDTGEKEVVSYSTTECDDVWEKHVECIIDAVTA